MPTLRKKQPAFEPSELVVSIASFSSETPYRGTTVKKGARLRGDDPVVLSHPAFFVREGTSDTEVAAIKKQRGFARHLGL
jgi:hypothetical protein